MKNSLGDKCAACNSQLGNHHGDTMACPISFNSEGMPTVYHMSQVFQPIGAPTGRKDDSGKARFDLIPFGPLEDIAKVLTFGAKKYAPNNWQVVQDGKERYEAAMLRHIAAYKQGELNDPETGLPHLAHAGCCLMFLQHLTREIP